jgi:hypothetical protein
MSPCVMTYSAAALWGERPQERNIPCSGEGGVSRGVNENGVAHRAGGEYTNAASPWRRYALNLILHGEGVFEALHALFQVLNLALLLGQQEVFDAVKPCRHLGTKLLDILL